MTNDVNENNANEQRDTLTQKLGVIALQKTETES